MPYWIFFCLESINKNINGGIRMKKAMWLFVISLFLGACSTEQPAENQAIDSSVATEEVDSSNEVVEETVTVNVEIIIDEEVVSELSKELEVEAGIVLLDVMKDHYDIEEENTFIQAIEGFEQNEDDNTWWVYELNEEEAFEGAADYEVQDGDQITWALVAF